MGIEQFFSTPLIIGAVLSILLAVMLDGLLVLRAAPGDALDAARST